MPAISKIDNLLVQDAQSGSKEELGQRINAIAIIAKAAEKQINSFVDAVSYSKRNRKHDLYADDLQRFKRVTDARLETNREVLEVVGDTLESELQDAEGADVEDAGAKESGASDSESDIVHVTVAPTKVEAVFDKLDISGGERVYYMPGAFE